MSNFIEVKLVDEMKYDHQGEKKTAKFVTLNKPTAKNINLTSVLKNTFQSGAAVISERVKQDSSDVSSKSESENEDEDETLGISPSDAVSLFYNAENGIEKSMDAFKKLLKDVGLFDGDVNATSVMVDALSVEDFENLLGEYLVNFILASLFKNQNKS